MSRLRRYSASEYVALSPQEARHYQAVAKSPSRMSCCALFHFE
jgi:hypothetical protein